MSRTRRTDEPIRRDQPVMLSDAVYEYAPRNRTPEAICGDVDVDDQYQPSSSFLYNISVFILLPTAGRNMQLSGRVACVWDCRELDRQATQNFKESLKGMAITIGIIIIGFLLAFGLVRLFT